MAVERTDFWRLDPGPGTDSIILDFHVGPEETLTPGESYGVVGLETGRSDSPSGAWPDHKARFERLLQYGPAAGQFALSQPTGGSIRFVQTHDLVPFDQPPGNSLLVALVPPANASSLARGMWALVESVTVERTLEHFERCTLDCVHLARLDRFTDGAGNPDFAACRDALEREGI